MKTMDEYVRQQEGADIAHKCGQYLVFAILRSRRY